MCLFREGAFILALREEKGLLIRNPLEKPVTALQACGQDILLKEPVLPGTERRVSLPCAPDGLRAFSGEEECCIFLPPVSF